MKGANILREKSLVSIIVPVYKVEPYLRECLDSIICQTYTNLEIILVDDGSPDRCGEICEDYARKDSRITVYHKENGGLSDARNYGIDRCNGEYITFIDSDDIIRSNYVATLIGLIQEHDTDAAVCGVSRFTSIPEGQGIDSVFPQNDTRIRVLSSHDMLEGILYQDFGTGCTYTVYTRRIFADIRFPKGLLYEDLYVTHKVHLLCKSVASTSEYLYGYRYNFSSIIQNRYSPRMLDCITVSRKLYGDVCEEVPDLATAAASRAFAVNRMVYLKIPFGMREERLKVWDEMKKYRRVIVSDSKARKIERLAALISYMGADVFHVLLSRLYRKRQAGA